MATLNTQSNASSDVFAGGSQLFEVQFETEKYNGVITGASGVTIAITASSAPDAGSGTPVAATSSGVTELGEGLYSYTWAVPVSQAPGSYLVTWSGTRLSDSATVTYAQLCMVAADPQPAPQPGLYATVAQYRAWSGDLVTPAIRVQTALMRATEDIDVALVAAVYRTDADGMPIDPGLVNVLVRATSAQAQYRIAVNDDANVKREFATVSAAGVSASRVQGMQGAALPPLAPQALAILRVAGVLPSAALINW